VVPVQMKTRFVAAAPAGDLIEAAARVRHKTRSLIFPDADVMRGEELIATASAIMKIAKTAQEDRT
jgi:acyl-coenzyme A thioesterase PaaI-like protein